MRDFAGQRKSDNGAVDTSLFPLRLVPFERYMLADDRLAYPMTFLVQVGLQGAPDRESMEGAFAQALARHPLLGARLTRCCGARHWALADGPPAVLRWYDGPAASDFGPGRRIDLRAAAPVAGEIWSEGDTATLLLWFHHAACDGIGAMRFLGDLLAFYGLRTAPADRRPTLLPMDPAGLAYRGIFDTRPPVPVTRWEASKGMVREVWKVLSRRPRVLQGPRRPTGSSEAEKRKLVTTTLPEQVYLRYSHEASALGSTANDVLLRDMFLTVEAWNRRWGVRRQDGWLRINMPTALRGKRDVRMPATNVLGYALITHHTRECRDPTRLLREIARETEAIRTWSLGAMFVEAIRMVDRVPGALWLGTRLSRRYATVVLSNLGDPTRRFRARFPRVGKEIQAGNLLVKSIFGAPPVRPGTRAALALFNYADRLTIALNADPQWLGASAAHDFLTSYEQQLRETARTVSPTGPGEAL